MLAFAMSALPLRRILVADDNPLTLRFFTAALGRLGIDSAAVPDGAAAVAEAQQAPFDLLLFDARMPHLDGAQALARIRAEAGPSRRAPAVATTADVDTAVHEALRCAGFADVLIKPLGLDALGTALARHLDIPGDDDALDDAQALAATGGDRMILDALRGLFANELDALPDELAAFGRRGDAIALRDRLHRLEASAGFCGAPALQRAATLLRDELAAAAWPHAAIEAFLARCARIRARLAP